MRNRYTPFWVGSCPAHKKCIFIHQNYYKFCRDYVVKLGTCTVCTPTFVRETETAKKKNARR